mmetsp:Transcript_4329/g.7216  ORF Transcript_4329/g.7216 Transcript_4329/m.7216 type:complete len:215 (+) Transcript_4329:97-741(+)|eukprot:CAMPEP_0119010202 /NCGR_PEP_ID=MMETSP1176-20130426/4861_1 /TAXON_ID=265551 /ORGANISM="Synedropsis recta cf, Strain CCMP1620" /LENGTH=214 /DNA_ID=CAMNT_0006962829 /DNA_START=94 /DNA_END=738 /DNA_ORIENTATION=-
MTSIVELFPKCRKLAYDARQQLAQVQNGVASPQDLMLSLEELSHQLDLMVDMVHRETPAQRQMWKRKIVELREDARTIQKAAEQYDRRVHSNLRQQYERTELLTRRRNKKSNATTEQNDMAHLTDESQSLQQSSLLVDDLLNTGEASLGSLVNQRSQLRGVRKVVADMANRLGLTNTTMRIIERRDITDAYLVLGGIVVTCIVIYICFFYFEKK